jgi:hypothetical protein
MIFVESRNVIGDSHLSLDFLIQFLLSVPKFLNHSRLLSRPTKINSCTQLDSRMLIITQRCAFDTIARASDDDFSRSPGFRLVFTI